VVIEGGARWITAGRIVILVPKRGGTIVRSFLTTPGRRLSKAGGYANRQWIANVTVRAQDHTAHPGYIPGQMQPLAVATLARVGLQPPNVYCICQNRATHCRVPSFMPPCIKLLCAPLEIRRAVYRHLVTWLPSCPWPGYATGQRRCLHGIKCTRIHHNESEADAKTVFGLEFPQSGSLGHE
jgi:hypothetical protein